MKKFTFLLFIIVYVFVCFTDNSSVVFAYSNYYGRVLTSNIFLYSSPYIIEDGSNRIFEIPKTYFVEILGEENELFYKANYNGVLGFVVKTEVSCISQTPAVPFVTNANFRVFTPSGANLRSSPNESIGSTNLVTTVPFLTTNLVFFGICPGEEAISYKGNIWYYCKYIKDNQEYFGYIYSPLCDLLTNFAENGESFEYITPNFEQTNLPTLNDEEPYLSLSSPWHIALIVLVSLPCIIIIYFLFKPTKIAMNQVSNSGSGKNKKRNIKPKKISRLKRSDYYELDSDYFR